MEIKVRNKWNKSQLIKYILVFTYSIPCMRDFSVFVWIFWFIYFIFLLLFDSFVRLVWLNAMPFTVGHLHNNSHFFNFPFVFFFRWTWPCCVPFTTIRFRSFFSILWHMYICGYSQKCKRKQTPNWNKAVFKLNEIHSVPIHLE